jgi:ABC-2 type transport system permease protein
VKKYWSLFSNYFISDLEYRANLIGGIIVELISTFGILFLWLSVFRTNNLVGGYTLNQALLYYLLVPTVGVFTQVYISNNLPYEIRLGQFSRYLLKPYNIWISAFVSTIASKINQILMIMPVIVSIVVVFSLITRSFIFNLNSLIVALVVIFFAIILHFFLDLTITWTAFWFDDVWSFQHLKLILFSVLGGVSFPFDFLPMSWRSIFNFLPFKFFYYIPTSYLTGKRELTHLFPDIITIIIWSLIFLCFAIYFWKRGIKKYGAYGG